MHRIIAQAFTAGIAAYVIWLVVRIVNRRKPTARFLLRSAGAICLLLGAWLAFAELRYQHQLAGIAVVERLGGSVMVHTGAPDWLLRLRPDEPQRLRPGMGPNWVRKLLPCDRFVRYSFVVTGVWLDNANGFHPYSNLSGERREVDVGGIKPTAQDLAILKRFTNLRELHLDATPVDDRCMAAIRDLRGLRELWLSDTDVTDASLEIVKGFGELERLGLDGTRVTDAGLAKLAHLKHLKELYVLSISGNVTEAGLAPFGNRPELKIH